MSQHILSLSTSNSRPFTSTPSSPLVRRFSITLYRITIEEKAHEDHSNPQGHYAVSPRRTASMAHGQRALGGSEDQRHLPRDLEPVPQERAQTPNSIKGVLSSRGVRIISVNQRPRRSWCWWRRELLDL
jgi:hypothetical protein